MTLKISQPKSIAHVQEQNALDSHPRIPHEYSDNLTTMSVKPIFSWVILLFNQTWLTIKSFIFCFNTSKSHNTAFNPEVDPSILGTRDPFYKLVFSSPMNLRNSEAYKLMCEMFDILGVGGFYHWGMHRSTINRIKEEILLYDIHPFESLYLLFHNEEIAKLVCHFLDKGMCFGITNEFVKEHAAVFKEPSKSIKPHIHGFCKLLRLDQKYVSGLADKEEWQELIRHTYKSRKKHFKL